MKALNLSDLRNPRKITAILHARQGFIKANPKDQGFQEYPESWELWQKLEDGRLLRVRRWLKKAVVCEYTDKKGV